MTILLLICLASGCCNVLLLLIHMAALGVIDRQNVGQIDQHKRETELRREVSELKQALAAHQTKPKAAHRE